MLFYYFHKKDRSQIVKNDYQSQKREIYLLQRLNIYIFLIIYLQSQPRIISHVNKLETLLNVACQQSLQYKINMIEYIVISVVGFLFCCKMVYCCCKNQQNRTSLARWLFVLSIMTIVMMVYQILRINQLSNINQNLIPYYTACRIICNQQYYIQGKKNSCCDNFSNYNCKDKITCQQEARDLYLNLDVIFKVFLIIAIAYFSIFILYLLWKRYCRNRYQPIAYNRDHLIPFNAQNNSPINNSESAEARLRESFRLRDSVSNCSICLQCYTEENKAIVLECSHMFHSDCIRDWIRRMNTCPLCRDVV